MVLPFEWVAKGTLVLAFAAFALAPSLRPVAVVVVAVVWFLGKLHRKHLEGPPAEPDATDAQEPPKID